MGSARATRVLAPAAVLAASVWLAMRWGQLGDYPGDAGPAMAALLSGHLGAALTEQPAMGVLSLLIRAPFALLGGGSQLMQYRWGAVPCVAAAGLLGLAAARRAGRAGAPAAVQVLLVVLCLFNPLTEAALVQGHPEELLGGALCAGAVLAATERRVGLAALLLGAALGTKQWAVLAIGPVLLAAPAGRARRRVVAAGALVALLLTIPLLARPAEFLSVQMTAAKAEHVLGVYSVWRPFGDALERRYTEDGVEKVSTARSTPDLAGRFSHPLIVLLGVLLPAALALRRRRTGRAADPLALLALLLLLRCALDPMDNVYYHAPLLLALAAWSPRAAALGLAGAWLAADWAPDALGNDGTTFLYIALAAAGAAALAQSTLAKSFGKRLRRSHPPSVTTTRSSIRTPSLPGT